MLIRILAVGSKMPAWVKDGCHDYQKRLPRELSIEWVELPLGERQAKKNRPQDIARAIAQENKSMMAAIDDRDYVIALDVKGKSWSTEVLAEQMASWQMEGYRIALLIGGPDGLSSECLQRAQQRWSLSELTLPHPLVRVLLIEQLYRAWTILKGHPYHK